MLGAFLKTVFAEAKRRTEDYKRLKAFSKLGDTVRKAAQDYGGLLGVFRLGLEKVIAQASVQSIDEIRTSMDEKLTETETSVIVLIDEIDRLSDSEVRALVQVIKSVADFERFSYLLAYDPDRVATALSEGNDLKHGHQYLEKIVQVQTRLPRIDESALVQIAVNQLCRTTRAYKVEAYGLKREEWEDGLSDLLRTLIPNVLKSPRDIRRMSTSFEARLPLIGHEVDWDDLIRYCALEAKVPVLSERLQTDIAKVTVDGKRELTERFLTPSQYTLADEDILAPFQDDAALKDLLHELFPALQEEDTSEVVRTDTHLCYETPLTTLLNFETETRIDDEDLSKQTSKLLTYAELETALESPGDTLYRLLERANSDGKIRHAILRVRTILHHRFDDYDVGEVLRVVGQYFDRPFNPIESNSWNDWAELTSVLVRAAMTRHIRNDWIGSNYVKNLIEEGQIHLPASLLWHCALSIGQEFTMKDSIEFIQPFGHSELVTLSESYRERTQVMNNKDKKFLWCIKSHYPFFASSLRNPHTSIFDLNNEERFPAYEISDYDMYGILILRARSETYRTIHSNREIHMQRFLPDLNLRELWRDYRSSARDSTSPIEVANRYAQTLSSS